MNDNRGWSNHPNVTLVHRVVTWLAEYQSKSPGQIPSVGDVAEALQANADEVSLVVDGLTSEGQALDGKTYDTGGSGAFLTPAGLAVASDWMTRRASTKNRRRACRDAALDFLYANDRNRNLDASDFLADQRSYFWGERFLTDDWQEALTYLANEKLVTGMLVGGQRRFVRPKILHRGQVCVENYDGDVVAISSPASAPSSVTNTTIANSPGAQWMSGSPGAQQTATVTISEGNRQQLLQIADQIAEQIKGLPVGVVPAATAGVEELRQVAKDNQADKGRVKALLANFALSVTTAAGTDAGQKILGLIGQAAQSLGG